MKTFTKVLLLSIMTLLIPVGGNADVKNQPKSRTVQIKTGETVKVGPGLKIKLLGVSHKITTEGDQAMVELELIDRKSTEQETRYLMGEMEWEGHSFRLLDTDESKQPRSAKIEIISPYEK